MKLVIKAGEVMLCSGAEIYRVEDTMERMLGACENIEDIQVVCTYSSIMVSFYYDNHVVTSIRKIRNISTNLEKISDVNNFSREFVSKKISLEGAILDLEGIVAKDGLSSCAQIFAFAMVSSFFTLTLDGSLVDFISTFIITSLSQYISYLTASQGRKYFIDTLLSSFIITFLAFFISFLGVPLDANKVVMGSIYMLFPGISLTNSVRDFMNRDLLAGTIGLIQAVLVAGALATGVGIVILIHSKLVV